MMTDFARHFGIVFRQPELLRLALTHRSYLSVTGMGERESNERLEFLGDSVLGLVTSEYLYRTHPTEHEGQLTKTKSLLVSKAILARRALAMGLGRFVFMSHSEVESGGRQRLSILADAFEAVLGAIYLDQGFEASRAFIHRWLLSEAREIASDKRHTNYKSHLQEYVQSTYRTHPVYRIRSEMGPDHSKQFMVEVMVGRRTMGSGKGRNKKEAEQAAARAALENVQGPRSSESRGGRTRDGGEEAPAREPRSESSRASIEPELEVEVEVGETVRRSRGARGRRERRAERELPDTISTPAPPPVERVRAIELDASVEEARREAPGAIASEAPRAVRYRADEFDEVGRPEGPLEERHVDPFAIEEEPGPASEPEPSPSRGQGRSVVSPSRPSRSRFDSDDLAGAAPEPPDRMGWRDRGGRGGRGDLFQRGEPDERAEAESAESSGRESALEEDRPSDAPSDPPGPRDRGPSYGRRRSRR